MQKKELINNGFYDELKDDWYSREDHPIALLRQENQTRNPWISKVLEKKFPGKRLQILDVGCGGGLLANHLALHHEVIGIDLSEKSLEIARHFDTTKSVKYIQASAMALPFPEESFDVVIAMDLLEHVENPQHVVEEASRVLKKGGLFFFHTFNRNFLSYALIIKGVDWFVPNAPKNMHIYDMFIKPHELENYMKDSSLIVQEIKGLVPKIFSKGLVKLLFKRKIDHSFQFNFSHSLLTGYVGFSEKIY